MSMQIHTIVSMPFAENTYVIWQDQQNEAIVIDPGFEPDAILDFLRERNLRTVAILNTHGHTDHIAGNEALKQAFPDAPLLIGVLDAPLLTDAVANLSASYGQEIVSPPADRTVREGEILLFGGIELEVRDIPGHSVGHVVFVVTGQSVTVFGGDVLFRGSVGRTDFPGGNFELLADGIRKKLFTLPADTVVYPGHGPVTTTGHERRTNRYVGDGR